MVQTTDRSFAGLDALRVFGALLVTAQHALTLLGHEDWTSYAGINAGQLGVALFLGISGFLSTQSRRPPFAWLGQRLRRLFPAYWLALAVSFAAAALTGYKQFDSWQVLAQAAGIGLFTHPHNLVNSPTWFISLLLLCYLGVFIGRLLRCPRALTLATLLVLTGLVAIEPRPWLLSHLLTFFVAVWLTLVVPAQLLHRFLGLAAGLFLLAAWWQPTFAYTGVPLLLLAVSGSFGREPRLVRLAAEYSYEYYLLHGLALFAAIRLCPPWWIAVPAGIVLSCVAAFLLRRSVELSSGAFRFARNRASQISSGPVRAPVAAMGSAPFRA
jgi:peptidoglycan/LPS O-acetylase OafA/YrhL